MSDIINQDPKRIHRETGTAWDIVAKAGWRNDVENDIAAFKRGEHDFVGPELALLGDLSSGCQRAIHLQCSVGQDALALWKLGAREVVGIDISEVALHCARQKADMLNAPATWYCCDILDTPHELDATADLVFTGCGALFWMMDLDAWAGVVHRLLKSGGRVLIFEGHPLDNVWDNDSGTYELRQDGVGYFETEPHESPSFPVSALVRATNANDSRPKMLNRHWRPGQVMNALSSQGLEYVHFDEYPDLFWNQFPNWASETLARLPHTYSIMMRKP